MFATTNAPGGSTASSADLRRQARLRDGQVLAREDDRLATGSRARAPRAPPAARTARYRYSFGQSSSVDRRSLERCRDARRAGRSSEPRRPGRSTIHAQAVLTARRRGARPGRAAARARPGSASSRSASRRWPLWLGWMCSRNSGSLPGQASSVSSGTSRYGTPARSAGLAQRGPALRDQVALRRVLDAVAIDGADHHHARARRAHDLAIARWLATKPATSTRGTGATGAAPRRECARRHAWSSAWLLRRAGGAWSRSTRRYGWPRRPSAPASRCRSSRRAASPRRAASAARSRRIQASPWCVL